MKIDLGKLAGVALRFAKQNPTLVITAIAAVAPGLAKKVAPIVVAAVVKDRGV